MGKGEIARNDCSYDVFDIIPLFAVELEEPKIGISGKGLRENIHNLFYRLVVNIGKYSPQKGKVRENNLCLTALVIFPDLTCFRQVKGKGSRK